MTDNKAADPSRNLVWDIPVRLVHWLLAGGFVAAFAIAEFGDDDGPLFSLHMVLGLLVVAVSLFRIVWGVLGTRTARFASFEWRPATLAAYFVGVLAGRGSKHIGHNPATSYATAATLLLALGIGASGALMTVGVGEEWDEIHEVLVFALLGIAIIHVAGVLLHTLRYRDDLVLSMIDGKKAVANAADATRPAWIAGAVLAVLALGTVGLGLAGYDPAAGSVVIPGIGWHLGESDGRDREHGASRHDDDHDEHHGHDRKKGHPDNE